MNEEELTATLAEAMRDARSEWYARRHHQSMEHVMALAAVRALKSLTTAQCAEALGLESVPRGLKVETLSINDEPPLGLNTGHGHVWRRPDGLRARCGGPGLCRECSRDAEQFRRDRLRDQHIQQRESYVRGEMGFGDEGTRRKR